MGALEECDILTGMANEDGVISQGFEAYSFLAPCSRQNHLVNIWMQDYRSATENTCLMYTYVRKKTALPYASYKKKMTRLCQDITYDSSNNAIQHEEPDDETLAGPPSWKAMS